MNPHEARDAFISRLADRDATRTEADLQADIYGLLTIGGLNLSVDQVARLETQTQDGTRRRLDVEIGNLAIEVKKDLRVSGAIADAELQLAGYVATRTQQTGARYVGVLTDGTTWHLYNLLGDTLQSIMILDMSRGTFDAERLVSWLEAVLSTQTQVKPTPDEIRRRLGASSPAHLVDVAALRALFDSSKTVPEVALKRELWAKLLRTAFGSAFDDDETLFINHTLLVISAEIIAHAALGFDVSATGGMSPRTLTLGTEFVNAQIFGVVQSDFFDWLLHADGGEVFIGALSRRIAQFDWSAVEHDVLKVLYESVIEQRDRKALGEYYTPDWLADRVVAEYVVDPLNQRVLDPSCGSGTFLFHAIRAYLAAADESGVSNRDAVRGVTDNVMGMDVHPVAVTLARVTYLLAIGADRLSTGDRGPIVVPVYLGDSLQWEQQVDVFSHEDNLTVSTSGSDLVSEGSTTLFGDDLVFPRSIVRDAKNFDRLVNAMADRAGDTSTKTSKQVILPVLLQFGVPDADVETVIATYDAMRRLHADGRDHIWGYYVRNLIRPVWLAEETNRVDVLIGNPPWLRYAAMTPGMQTRFGEMMRKRGLLPGSLGASGRDLSTLFVVRATELYLRHGGTFAFVMPHGTLTRQPHSAFRSGVWNGPAFELRAQFGTPWDLSKAATGFPVTSCVINGRLSEPARSIPAAARKWTTRGTTSNVTWASMSSRTTVTDIVLSPTAQSDAPATFSPYKKRFRQGAILVPRVLTFANEIPAGPLGVGSGRVTVNSRRSQQEKEPWKSIEGVHAVVEQAFTLPAHLGETVVPFGLLEPLKVVLPVSADGSRILNAQQIASHDGLASWWNEAEIRWAANKSLADAGTFLDRIDFHGQLSAQLPAASNRVVYTKAGGSISSARVSDNRALIDHKLYWAAANSEDEARYLVAILNSAVLLERVQPFQNLGLFGPRDFDKNVFRAPIPPFDENVNEHRQLAELSKLAETLVSSLELDTSKSFQTSRKTVRIRLVAAGILPQIESLVAQIIPPVLVG